MDIRSRNKYPANRLSNFACHRFILDDVTCNSMEGFLQSLKCKTVLMQEHICTMVGYRAKEAGKNRAWWKLQILYWKGVPIDRHSDEYQDLLDRAYIALYTQSKSFKKALLITRDATLTHSIGKHDSHKTILTEREFCGRLRRLRDNGYL